MSPCIAPVLAAGARIRHRQAAHLVTVCQRAAQDLGSLMETEACPETCRQTAIETRSNLICALNAVDGAAGLQLRTVVADALCHLRAFLDTGQGSRLRDAYGVLQRVEEAHASERIQAGVA